MSRDIQKIHFSASSAVRAQEAYNQFVDIHGNSSPEEADVIVVLGGDGFMLRSLHGSTRHGKPLYGVNCGSVGFLMNEYRIEGLKERLSIAEEHIFHPLKLDIFESDTVMVSNFIAVNDVSILRMTPQAAKLKVMIDNQVRLHELVCDGLIVATPVGSSAYNFSAHGPILPLDSPLLALTPVSPARPRRWRGALLPNNVLVEVQILEHEDRPVIVAADFLKIESKTMSRIQISQLSSVTMRILSDTNRSWSDRILAEQFPFDS
ncbi:MAG: NAD kinase [Candidatus Liberibacter ctenarytainae]|uniref:NAD kinase n=1 Tax=Candidatus Liberibacter ctenarytainae TaxID=2020335 RepID=A0A937DKX6_9HYPH|nr:NAD kinase [Candidatus Liberibacter ctenarytainae]